MIADGYEMIYTAPHLTIVPGLMIIATVLSLNVFGDGLRDALDPRGEDPAGALSRWRNGTLMADSSPGAFSAWSRCCSRSR